MTPNSLFRIRSVPRRGFLLAGLTLLGGCTSPLFFRGQSPDDEPLPIDEEDVKIDLVGDHTGAWGLNFSEVESVALVTQLAGTGSDPRPSAQRERLVAEMLSHQAESPRRVLASTETSMAIVIGRLPPGIQKGEQFDVEVQVPKQSQTTSLKGGFLMQTRLRPMEVLGGGIRTGHVVALARGPVMVDSVFEGDSDEVLQTRGRVLGGGVAMISRPMGLVIRDDSKSVFLSAAIGKAINRRFDVMERGARRGVAIPKDDKIIELALPRQYKHNIARYFRVVRSIAVKETPTNRMDRLELLKRQLHEPTTAAVAALRLEAIGEEAVKVLIGGSQSSDPEVRFYSAEALSYLGKSEAIPILAQAAREEPAFRWHALTALASFGDVEAGSALSDLLHVTSAETRYGAFRAMQARSKDDPLVRGEALGDGFRYHVIPTSGEPMVHVTRMRTPEIVLFGAEQTLNTDFVSAENGWTLRGVSHDRMKITYHDVKGDVKYRDCSNRLDDVIRSMAELGAGYIDVITLISKAKKRERLNSRFVIDAVPRRGRGIRRPTSSENQKDSGIIAANPLPELFSAFESDSDAFEQSTEVRHDVTVDKPKKGFFARMFGTSG